MPADGNTDKAISLLALIENPDTKALTIRGISMEAKHLDLTKEQRDTLFTTLQTKAKTIKHPPSYGIAMTYIAMAQTHTKDKSEAF